MPGLLHPRRRGRPRRWTAVTTGLVALAALLLSGPTAQATPDSGAVTGNSGAFTDPAADLGTGWKSSTDELLTGLGDSQGFHILEAMESKAFAWSTLATLTVPGVDAASWTGYTCPTGDGRYVAAVYAPSTAANSPAQRAAGAFAAVVNVATGKVTQVASGMALDYFTPSCGTGDQVVFTRNTVDESQTQVMVADASTGRLVSSSLVKAQFTTPVPTAADVYGVAHGDLVRMNANGTLSTLARPQGQPYALAADSAHGLQLLSVDGSRSVLQRWNGSGLVALGTAQSTNVGLFSGLGGHNTLVGDATSLNVKAAPGLRSVPAAEQPDAVSFQGDAVAESITSADSTSAPSGSGWDQPTTEAAVRSARTGTVSHAEFQASGPVTQTFGQSSTSGTASGTASGTTAVKSSSTVSTSGTTESVTSAAVTALAATTCDSGVSSGYDASYPVALVTPPSCDTVPTCLVARNSATKQVLQPSENMVEWAVDQAVHADLTITRPANYDSNGESSYSPESMFPAAALTGGGTIPAQVMLAILAQESNLKQASWHAVPGDAGNPLVSDYYGNGDSISSLPNYTGTDCGYGIAQVTDGMSSSSGSPMTEAQASAVATDYAANIAAGVQILGQTWNELQGLSTPMTVNDGSAQYIENWYYAIWGYNSGVYTDPTQNDGHVGLGWANNPANPAYDAAREPFMRYDTGDAAHPGDWPYQERVLGWAENPQVTYGSATSYTDATYATSECTVLASSTDTACFLNLPTNYRLFCSTAVNDCDPSTTSGSPCPATDSTCWWNQPVSWISGDESTQAATEHLAYPLGSAEPAINSQYAAPDCSFPSGSTGTFVIGTEEDSSKNVFGCPGGESSGKFSLRLGDSFAGKEITESGLTLENPLTAQIDLHQLGAGWMGHIYFTHTYPLNDYAHKVTAQWAPDPSAIPAAGEQFDIHIHLPSHGNTASSVYYLLKEGVSSTGAEPSVGCTKSQVNSGQDEWVDLGTAYLWPGARLLLSNLVSGATGTSDIAFDAVAFSPATSGSWCP